MNSRSLRLPVLLLVVLLVSAPLLAEPQEKSTLDELLAQPLTADESYRLVRFSDQVVFAKLASAQERMSLFVRVGPATGVGAWSGPALSMTNTALERALSATDESSEEEHELVQELTKLGFFPARGAQQVLITLLETQRAEQLFDFTDSERLEATQREADLLSQGRSTDPNLDARLATRFGGTLAKQALHDAAWKFDDLADIKAEEDKHEAERLQLAAGMRARFLTEAVRGLYWVDPTYESAIISWLERLSPQQTNQLAQLLQVAGVAQMSPEILVRESAPNLHQLLVMNARLYQRLESVTLGGTTKRQLNPDQFANDEILSQAKDFYQQFFATDRKGRFEYALTGPVEEFLQLQSAFVRELSEPHLEQLLGPSWHTD